MEKSTVKIEADPWLAQIIGRDTFKISLPQGMKSGNADSEKLVRDIIPKKTFCYAKVATERVDHVCLLNAVGFYVVDVNLTFELDVSMAKNQTVGDSISIREAVPSDSGPICDIAASCFLYSRFHLDPQISKETADNIKRSWIGNYFAKKRGDNLWVAEVENKPAGFLAALKLKTEEKLISVIDLVGVSTSYWKRGIGRVMVNNFIHDSVNKSMPMRVGTQAANIPSVRLYENCGFRLASSTYVMHGHFK